MGRTKCCGLREANTSAVIRGFLEDPRRKVQACRLERKCWLDCPPPPRGVSKKLAENIEFFLKGQHNKKKCFLGGAHLKFLAEIPTQPDLGSRPFWGFIQVLWLDPPGPSNLRNPLALIVSSRGILRRNLYMGSCRDGCLSMGLTFAPPLLNSAQAIARPSSSVQRGREQPFRGEQ